MTASPGATLILLCQPGFEPLLAEELGARRAGLQPPPTVTQGTGWVAAAGLPEAALPAALRRPLIFERQRLHPAVCIPAPDSAPAADAALAQAILARHGADMRGETCVVHAYAVPTPAPRAASRRALTLGRLVCAATDAAGPLAPGDTAPGAAAPAHAARVLQIAVAGPRVFCAMMPPEALSDPRPGGVHLARRDDAAPSRSALKIEEVLEVLDDPPRPGERVVDLGAAPGGWSRAFLKRGCRVLAVDNGPLKIPDLAALSGELTHLRADGMGFVPQGPWRPADWWLSDMLIPPGKALGLLRRWVGEGWCRRFVVNVKLPQARPLAALAPIEAYLASVPELTWRLRHLFHDRREVTLTGTLAAPRSAVVTPRDAWRRASGSAAKSAPRRGRPDQSATRRGKPARGGRP